MKASRPKLIVAAVLLILAIIAAGFLVSRLSIPGWDESVEYVALDSVKIGQSTIQFYVEYSYDTAILGFSVPGKDGSPRYFPMYGSTYRGLPAVTLDVYVPETQDEMWVRSSWKGYEILAYHRLGTDRCMTEYGEITSIANPTPEGLGGERTLIPKMDTNTVSKVATITFVK